MSKLKSISDEVANAAWMSGYVSGPDWAYVLSEEVKEIFSSQATKFETSLGCVVANVLASISAVLGPRTSIKIRDDYILMPNIYQMLVATSGSGKSHTYRNLFLKPLRELEKRQGINLIMEEFTTAGFLKFLSQNNGYAILASDEFCQGMRAKLSSSRQECQEFRSNLNKFYNGDGVTKLYASKAQLRTDDVYLSIYGLTQPKPYSQFQFEVENESDGLLNRFMVLCVPSITEDQNQDGGNEPVAGRNLYSEVAEKYLHTLYGLHGGNNNSVTYQFDEGAQEYLTGLRKLSADAKKAATRAAEEKVRAGTMESLHIPTEFTEEKDFEYVAKYATILHVLTDTIGAAIEQQFAQIIVTPVINKATVERAHSLVASMRNHQRHFKKTYEEVVTPVADAVQLHHVIQKDVPIEKHILMFPGKVVTSYMICRKHRAIHCRSMDLPQKMQSMSKEPGSEGYVGQYEQIGATQHVFFKTSPEKVDREYLKSLKISPENYEKMYNADMTTAPCSGFPDWARYYQNLLAASPDDL